MSDSKLDEKMKNIFPDPEIQAKLVDALTSERPFGWSHKSNAPYYKRLYAEQIKKDIDAMLEKKEALLTYRYDKWCTDDTQMSPQTLYNRINQSIRYLIERMDTPDRKYAQWYETVHISRKTGVGIVIKFITGLEGADITSFSAEHIQSEQPAWRTRMDNWLESDDVRPFVQDGLILSPEEIAELKMDLSQLSTIISDIKSSSVKLIKVSLK